MVEHLPISVILPTRNRGELLQCPLESLCDQLGENDELVLSINGEVKITTELAESYRDRIAPAQLRIVRPEKELEIYQHWFFAIQQARNPWIVFLHDDEVYRRDLLPKVRDILLKEPEVSLITGGTLNVEVAEITKVWLKNKFDNYRVVDGKKWISEQLVASDINYGSTCYIFKNLKGNYDFLERETRVSDILLMFSQASEGKVVEIPEFLGTHLLHANNQSWMDYLTPGQIPYWKGLYELGEKKDIPELFLKAEKERNKAYKIYLGNALRAALPRGNQRAFLDCLDLAAESKGKDLKISALKCIGANSILFRSLSFAVKLLRKYKGKKIFWSTSLAQKTLSVDQVPNLLVMTQKQWKNFELIARSTCRK